MQYLWQNPQHCASLAHTCYKPGSNDHEAVSPDILISMAGLIPILKSRANYTAKSVSFIANSVKESLKRPPISKPDLIPLANIYEPIRPIKVPQPLHSSKVCAEPCVRKPMQYWIKYVPLSDPLRIYISYNSEINSQNNKVKGSS